MGFYDKYILPKFLNCACGSKPINYQREKIVPLAEGKVLDVGICEQNNSNNLEESCGIVEAYKNNIRKIKLDYKQAKGPMYARSLINTLYFGENYFWGGQ